MHIVMITHGKKDDLGDTAEFRRFSSFLNARNFCKETSTDPDEKYWVKAQLIDSTGQFNLFPDKMYE